MSVCLPLYLSAALSLCRSVRLSVCLPICQSPHLLSVYLFVRLASCLLSVLSFCIATYSLSRVLPPVRVFTVRLLSVLSHFLGLRFPQFCLLQDGELKCFVVFAPGLLPSTETTHISASLSLPTSPLYSPPLPIPASTTLCLSRLLRLRLSVARPVVSLVSFRLFAWLIVQLFS